MANINKSPRHTAHLSRTGFDMSQRRLFTSSVGQLLPVYYDISNPGDHFRANLSLLSRTDILQTSAFARITEHVDFFFVPLTQLYTFFDSYIYGINDIKSSLADPSKVGSILPRFYINQLYDVFVTGEELSQSLDDYDVPTACNAERLCNLLGYGHVISRDTNSSNNSSCNPLLIAAYQKIFNDYYRLSDRNAPDLSYNLDKFYQTGLVDDATLFKLFKLRYRPFKKDFFTNNVPQPLNNQGNVSSLFTGSQYANVNNWLSDTSVQTSNTGRDIDIESIADLGVSDIRSAFALDKLNRITSLSPKHYDKQTAAHFGFDVPQGVSNEVYYLGSHSQRLAISEIESTADGSNGSSQSYLGQISGKGFALDSGGNIDFTAPCHGIFMAIYSAVPETEYRDFGCDRINRYLNNFDFYQPEFDDLGMQPLFRYQEMDINPSTNAGILGWQYRYSELKSKPDLIHGAFLDSKSDWVTPRLDLGAATASDPRSKSYYISPDYINPIMLTGFNTQDWSKVTTLSHSMCYATDPLMHSLEFDIKKTSVMSTYGLPNL